MKYGRNVEILQNPLPEHRLGRFKTGATAIAIGAPVYAADGSVPDAQDRLEVALATSEMAPVVGLSGILIWENWDARILGEDPVTIRRADLKDAPAATPVQVVFGTEVRVEYLNTDDESFQGQATYDGVKMVLGLGGATPDADIEVGALLTPGPGDATGLWQVTADATKAWLRVTHVDHDLGVLQAQMVF